tara:strand:- start:10063 stop:10335 length:273 start_codon:yes stop_codon:yes gene_type:complete
LKYITSVIDGRNIKHIVEVNGKNVEVVQVGELENYGNRKGNPYFSVNNINVSKDFNFRNANGNSDYSNLATVVYSIELVRFVDNYLKGER